MFLITIMLFSYDRIYGSSIENLEDLNEYSIDYYQHVVTPDYLNSVDKLESIDDFSNLYYSQSPAYIGTTVFGAYIIKYFAQLSKTPYPYLAIGLVGLYFVTKNIIESFYQQNANDLLGDSSLHIEKNQEFDEQSDSSIDETRKRLEASFYQSSTNKHNNQQFGVPITDRQENDPDIFSSKINHQPISEQQQNLYALRLKQFFTLKQQLQTQNIESEKKQYRNRFLTVLIKIYQLIFAYDEFRTNIKMDDLVHLIAINKVITKVDKLFNKISDSQHIIDKISDNTIVLDDQVIAKLRGYELEINKVIVDFKETMDLTSLKIKINHNRQNSQGVNLRFIELLKPIDIDAFNNNIIVENQISDKFNHLESSSLSVSSNDIDNKLKDINDFIVQAEAQLLYNQDGDKIHDLIYKKKTAHLLIYQSNFMVHSLHFHIKDPKHSGDFTKDNEKLRKINKTLLMMKSVLNLVVEDFNAMQQVELTRESLKNYDKILSSLDSLVSTSFETKQRIEELMRNIL